MRVLDNKCFPDSKKHRRDKRKFVRHYRIFKRAKEIENLPHNYELTNVMFTRVLSLFFQAALEELEEGSIVSLGGIGTLRVLYPDERLSHRTGRKPTSPAVMFVPSKKTEAMLSRINKSIKEKE